MRRLDCCAVRVPRLALVGVDEKMRVSLVSPLVLLVLEQFSGMEDDRTHGNDMEWRAATVHQHQRNNHTWGNLDIASTSAQSRGEQHCRCSLDSAVLPCHAMSCQSKVRWTASTTDCMRYPSPGPSPISHFSFSTHPLQLYSFAR